MVHSARLWIGRDDHFLHRIELSPPAIQPPPPKPGDPPNARANLALPKTTSTFVAVKFNPPLTPANFTYTPPPGAKVKDAATP